MKKILALVLLSGLVTGGCVPVLIGGLFYQDAKTDEERRTFIEAFNKNNTDRELKGLKPLDLCEEKVNFDTDWAFENKICKAKFEDKIDN